MSTVTRAQCQEQLDAVGTEWADKLGLAGEWGINFSFGRNDIDSDLEDSAALVKFDHVHRSAQVRVMDRVKPEFYEHEVIHELLHIVFQPLHRAIDELTEPAKSLLEDVLHARIARLTRLLSGKHPRDGEECGERPPWEVSE